MGDATLRVGAVCIVCGRADWGMDAEVEGDEQPDGVDLGLQHAVLGQRQFHQSRRKRFSDSHKRQGYLKLPIPSDDADDGAAKSAYRRRWITSRAAYLIKAGVWDSKQRLTYELRF